MSKFETIYADDWQGRPTIAVTINLDDISTFSSQSLKMKNKTYFEIGEQTYKQLMRATTEAVRSPEQNKLPDEPQSEQSERELVQTTPDKDELRKKVLSLCDKLREHVDLDHPDPDMTRSCQWPSDTTDEIMALFAQQLKQFKDEVLEEAESAQDILNDSKGYDALVVKVSALNSVYGEFTKEAE